MPDAEFLPLGPDGCLIRFADALSEPANRAALAARAAIDAAEIPGVLETATSLTSVFVRFRPDRTHRATLQDALNAVISEIDGDDAELPSGRTRWHIPAIFEGDAAPDLEAVAAEIGRSPDDAIAELTQTPLRVLALGFAPGQPYLGFMPDHWNIPRRTEVTPEVPRGAVVVAVRQVIPFANAAPTGWWQIGRTAFRCFDPDADPPLPLKPGDEVLFHAAPAGDWERLVTEPRGEAEPEALP